MGKLEITKNEKKILKEFEKNIGYRFKDRDKLMRALTHKSYAYEKKLAYEDHNERYEYLGDAVIELCISTMLFEKFPKKSEGELSRLRAASVNEAQLAEIAKLINLGDFVFLGKGEDNTGGREKNSILSDTFEALCGSIYLDRGISRASKFMENNFQTVMEKASDDDFMCDYKTKLQEVVQAKYKTMPKYVLIKTSGPDHSKMFEVELYVSKNKIADGKGRTKKTAEQNAAKVALSEICK